MKCEATTTPRQSLQSSDYSVVERRAADVLVLGSSSLAAAAAYSLARRGKKVILVSDLGVQAPRPPPQQLHPLVLPDTSPEVAYLNHDAAAYWRGLQSQAPGTALLLPCSTLDLACVAPGTSGSSSSSSGGLSPAASLSLIQESSKAAGVKLGSLKGQDLAAVFRNLRANAPGLMGLVQPNGGLLDPRAATRALRSLAERAGALVRDSLVLRGWRDAGDHFVVRGSSALQPGAMSVFEGEQLLLAPEEGEWSDVALHMFGLQLPYLRVVEGRSAACAASTELSALPLLRFWGGSLPDAPQAPPPMSSSSSTSTAAAAAAKTGSQPAAAAPAGAPATPCFEFMLLPAVPGGRDSSRCVLAEGGPWGTPARAWSWAPGAEADLSTLLAHNQRAASLVRNLGPVQAGSAATQLLTATPDGMPLLGFHPGFEAGRVLVASCVSAKHEPSPTETSAPGSSSSLQSELRSGSAAAERSKAGAPSTSGSTGSTGGSSPPAAPISRSGYQLSPLLAKFGADMLMGLPLQDIDRAKLDLERASCMQGSSSSSSSGASGRPPVDSWEELWRLQGGSWYLHRSREEVEREAEAAEERRRAEERPEGKQGGTGKLFISLP